MKEKVLTSTYLHRGRIVTLREDRVETAYGKQVLREVVEHAPAVAVFPFEFPNKIHLIRQYRHPVEKILIEAPAGLIDPNEDVLVAAKRELKEETGFSAKKWAKLAEMYTAPGFCDEYMTLYLAMELEDGDTDFDEDELIERHTLTFDQIEEAIKDGKIIDAKTIAGCLLVRRYVETHHDH